MPYHYEIFLDGKRVDSERLQGIATLKYMSACLIGEARLERVSSSPDPVLGGRSRYDDETGGWVDVH